MIISYFRIYLLLARSENHHLKTAPDLYLFLIFEVDSILSSSTKRSQKQENFELKYNDYFSLLTDLFMIVIPFFKYSFLIYTLLLIS